MSDTFCKQNIPLLFLLILLTGGCQPPASSKLLGKWVGRPDSVEARRKREAEKYGDSKSEAPTDSLLNQELPKTDWEGYEVETEWNFESHGDLHMTLEGSPKKVSGTWKVIETSPTGCVVEVETVEETKEKAVNDKPQITRRRFEVEFDDREDETVGFLLYEEGADRQLGSLYFSRPGTAQKQPNSVENQQETE